MTDLDNLRRSMEDQFAIMAAALDALKADLAEIKARLAHASPGYDMQPATLEEYETLAKADRGDRRLKAGEQEDGR